MPYPFMLSSMLLPTQRTSLPRTFCRYKSITAAIEKGRGSGPDRFAASRPRSRSRTSFRDDQVTPTREEGPEGGPSRPSRSKSSIGARRRRWEDEDEGSAPRRKELRKRGRRPDESAVDRRIRDQDRDRPLYARSGAGQGRWTRFDEDAPRQRPDDRTSPRDDRTSPSNDRTSPRHDRDNRGSQSDGPRRSRDDAADPRAQKAAFRDRAPDSLPYTTAASEFIYGYSSVLAAIRANRRQYYKLYVNARGLNRDILLARAKASNLRQITREVGDQYDRAFDKASSGRPHNGFILEASPLPVPPITELKECSREEAKFEVVLGPQTKEELAVNGTRTAYRYNSSSWRYPLILYLDGVLDQGNLGAIARSAYLLGVEAIVTPTRQSAPWSHIAIKASAGAAEALPIFKTTSPTDFLTKASRNGWRCYAAAAIPAAPENPTSAAAESSDIVYSLARSSTPLHAHSPVADHPTILMLGAEGAGLKNSLLNLAHYNVGISHGREVNNIGVDSLNVSVAASLLCFDILKRRDGVVRDPENVVF